MKPNYYITLIALFSCLLVLGQSEKSEYIYNQRDTCDYSLVISEYQLDSSGHILLINYDLVGKMTAKYTMNKLEFGKKEGPFEKYDSLGALKMKGNYKNNLHHDTVLCFYPSGKLKRFMLFFFGKEVARNCFLENGNETQCTTFSNLDDFNTMLYLEFRKATSQINYPKESLELGEQGKVFVSFVITEKAKITDVRIERGVSEALDKETLRIIRILNPEFPLIEEGEAVPTKIRVPINFTLH